MFALFPSLAITSFLHFWYWSISFSQCATIHPGVNYYKKTSSLLLLLLFLELPSQHFACYKQLLVSFLIWPVISQYQPKQHTSNSESKMDRIVMGWSKPLEPKSDEDETSPNNVREASKDEQCNSGTRYENKRTRYTVGMANSPARCNAENVRNASATRRIWCTHYLVGNCY